MIAAVKAASVVVFATATSIVLLLASSAPSYAIPSPDLVVGSISSISQLVALVSAMIGSGAVVVGVRATANASDASRAARTAWRVAAAALVFLGLSLAANYHQYSIERSQRQTRLEAAILRPTETSDGHTLDANLKEASYDDQLRSPLGISTAEVERLIGEKQRGLHSNDVLVDVREHAETATGSLPNATPIRFPDFQAAHLDLAGKTVVLFCDNGNRSYETCQKLAALGIDCRFMVGGLEKWFAEHRPLADGKATSLADFRSLPNYANKKVLLDTPDIRELLAKGAVFVDVRYPGEFAAYHLPGAINLPIRPTVAEELRTRIAALPHRPIIAPCYDRRSCFYAQILGYEVTQAGYDFRGRYTVPWDYYQPVPPRPYIQEYLNELHRSWWGKLVDIVAVALNRLADHTGFLAAIVLLALLSRTLVSPVSVKAERDQIVSRDLVDEVDELKRRLGADRRRLARAMRAFYRRHSLTPLRNLLGLAFLPVMSVCVAAIHAVAVERHQSLLWTANSAQRDSTFILPVLFAALICIYLDLAFVRTHRHRLLVWPIGMIVLTAIGSFLNVAVDVYLVTSAILLLVQRAVVTIEAAELIRWYHRRRLNRMVVSLDDIKPLFVCGNKAHRLGIMRSHGFAVPQGIVLTAGFLKQFSNASAAWRSRELDRIWRFLGTEKVAVRSSGSAEDGSSKSFAGVFESVLNVDRARLEAAVVDVLSSFDAAVVTAYGGGNGHANIIVQRMIDPDYSGVLFTRDLACPSHSLVEFVEGTADKLVSGTVTPTMCRFGRISSQSIGGDTAPIDLSPLVAIGRKLESLFGCPQDVEWVHADGVFQIVQSRDITRPQFGAGSEVVIQSEWSRVLDCAAGAPPDEIVFAQNELSEVLPRPTILSLSLMEALWASGGGIDLACRKLGLGYRVEEDSPPYLATIFGRLFVDKRQEKSRAPKLNALAVRRLKKMSGKIAKQFQDDFLPGFLKEIAVQEAIDFDRLPTADLLEAVTRIYANYLGSTGAIVSVVNIAADFYLQRAKEELIAAGKEPARYLAHSDQTEFERAVINANNDPAECRQRTLLQAIGHRSTVDYELAEPRYVERPSDLDQLFGAAALPARTAAETNAGFVDRVQDPALADAVRIACSFQTLKENAKHHSLRELAVLRRAILAVDRRFELGGLVFQLTFEDIAKLGDESVLAELRVIAQERRERASQLAGLSSLSSVLTVRQIEDCAIGIKSESLNGAGESIGIRVSGSGVVEGRACVVKEDDAETVAVIPNFKDGDIVVSRMLPAAWIPYFHRATGFVCEVGGWLSHTAIVAREFNVPLIVQAKGIRTIETGASIRLYPDGTVQIMAQSTEDTPV